MGWTRATFSPFTCLSCEWECSLKGAKESIKALPFFLSLATLKTEGRARGRKIKNKKEKKKENIRDHVHTKDDTNQQVYNLQTATKERNP